MATPRGADQPVRLLPRLRHALALQRARIESVLEAGGEEAIHDLRVALRRTSALARLGRGIPEKTSGEALRSLSRDLRGALSLHRSHEVSAARLLKRFDGDPRRRAAARAAARRLFGTAGSGSPLAAAPLLKDLRKLGELFGEREKELVPLCRPTSASGDRRFEARFRRRASRRLGKLVARLLEAGRPSRASLHAFRIAAKELRYTLEFLDGAVAEAAPLLSLLRSLQDEAGEAHDWMELAATVRALASRARPDSPVRLLTGSLESDVRTSLRKALSTADLLLARLREVPPDLPPDLTMKETA